MEFDVGSFVYDVLTTDRFSAGDYNKLKAKKISPLKIIAKINPNAYHSKLPSYIRTSNVFNFKHLFPFLGDSSDDSNLRKDFSKASEDNVDEVAYQYLDEFDRAKVIEEA